MKARAVPRIPSDENEAVVRIGGRDVRLTNLDKIFWPKGNRTKGDLLRYYASVAKWLLPHLEGRAEVMKRYPNGIRGECFYMKRAPTPRPEWIDTCTIEHRNAGPVPYPIVNDLASLLWLVNLGCIDLNPWYSACGDFERPDCIHFDLDPVPGVGFAKVREAALLVREFLEKLRMPVYAKSTGATGMHLYVPIVDGREQKEVWHVAKAIAFELEAKHPKLLTAQYRIAKRPKGTVLVDYNQNAWGKTLASVYSVRPTPEATVSTPVTWEEVERGFEREDFTIDTVPARLVKMGDLWKPVLGRKRFDLDELIARHSPAKRSRTEEARHAR
jgi:bifunctional non-homologous end joining protein LigD